MHLALLKVFKEEFQWIRMMEGDRVKSVELVTVSITESQESKDHLIRKFPERVRWVKRAELDEKPHLCKLMVPVCRQEESEDGVSWYIARIPHIVRRQCNNFR